MYSHVWLIDHMEESYADCGRWSSKFIQSISIWLYSPDMKDINYLYSLSSVYICIYMYCTEVSSDPYIYTYFCNFSLGRSDTISIICRNLWKNSRGKTSTLEKCLFFLWHSIQILLQYKLLLIALFLFSSEFLRNIWCMLK